MKKQETVFVGLSGGVDSAVAAKRLIDMGYRVVGVFIKVWYPDFVECSAEKDRLDAMRVAAYLKVPFLTFDAARTYRERVADYLISEYRNGRTPNPDVMCNEHVKFGVFLDFALSSGATKIATGHYARIREQDGRHQLYRGTDPEKDQSYFLWRLTEAELRSVLFPVGNSTKPAVRNEAREVGIPNFAKRDSQGICFLGQIDMKEFLKHYINDVPGMVFDLNGNVVGTHHGAHLYTLGERMRADTPPSDHRNPQYVVAKDLQKNTITIATQPLTVSAQVLSLDSVIWRGESGRTKCEAQFRYRQSPFQVTVEKLADGYAKLRVDSAGVDMPSSGQSCVLYEGARCIGGGIIGA